MRNKKEAKFEEKNEKHNKSLSNLFCEYFMEHFDCVFLDAEDDLESYSFKSQYSPQTQSLFLEYKQHYSYKYNFYCVLFLSVWYVFF